MIAIDDKLVSEELIEKKFVCDLNACKGACCVEGEDGAPLEFDELTELEDHFDDYRPFLTEKGIKAIESKGHFYHNEEKGSFHTSLIKGGECAYLNYENGIAVCGLEKAYEAGKSSVRKPVSCHLYPVRITKYEDYEAVNYESWEICNPACQLGQQLQLPLYQFVKDGLIRKYGQAFYDELAAVANYLKNRDAG